MFDAVKAIDVIARRDDPTHGNFIEANAAWDHIVVIIFSRALVLAHLFGSATCGFCNRPKQKQRKKEKKKTPARFDEGVRRKKNPRGEVNTAYTNVDKHKHGFRVAACRQKSAPRLPRQRR